MFILFINLQINLFGNLDTLFYNRFQIGGQIFYTNRLIDNGIVADNNLNISKDYRILVNNFKNPPYGFYEAPRSFFEIDKTMILGNINFTYNFDIYNSLSVFSEFSFKQHFVGISENNRTYIRTTDFGDGMMNLLYFKRLNLFKKINLKIGIGAGLIISPRDDFNSIFDIGKKLNFAQNIYNDMPAYFLGDDYVFTTKELYRTNIDLNVPIKASLDFTTKYKSYFSIISGLNIIPYNYMCVEGRIYNYKTGEIIKQEKFHYQHINFYFGIGYSFGWKQKTN